MTTDRWVSVGRDLSESVSRHAHAVRPGAVTSACGATALPADTWRRPNTLKPKCPRCLRNLGQADSVVPPRDTSDETGSTP